MEKSFEPLTVSGYGQRFVDDMFQTSSMFVYFTEDEFRAELAAREAKRRLATGTAAQQQQ